MRPGDNILIQEIEQKLATFDQDVKRIPGVRAAASRLCLSRQILDSIRRVRYVTTISGKAISQSITNPNYNSFSPLKAAVWHRNNGNIDEAFWLVFLATHFGKHKRTGWNLIRNVYGMLNDGNLWTWENLTDDPRGFEEWIDDNSETLSSCGKFSNHRKYESISKTGKVVSSYIDWVGDELSHQQKIESFDDNPDGNNSTLFDTLYHSMNSVYRFGRTAKFDYLCMLGKLGLADIEPGLTYMSGATGPIVGARLLFRNENLSPKELEFLLSKLNEHLELQFGMQVLEDALCNWQKNPSRYEYFGG